jgi:hypothetical protein
MDKIVAFLKAPGWIGLPWGAWIFLIALLVGNQIIAWAKWTKAQDLLQGLARLVLKIPLLAPVIARFPFVGWALTHLAGPEEGVERRTLLGTKKGEPPPSGAAVVLVFAALGMLLAGAGCGGATTAYRVIDSATALGRTGFDLVHEIDKEKQDAIADEKDRTGDVEAAKAKLREWREKRDKARAALKTYAAAVATAGATLDLVVAGQEKRLTIGMVLAEVAKAIAQIKSVLEAFGVKVPLLSAWQPPPKIFRTYSVASLGGAQ